jgi:hypothetical protein
VLTDIDILIQRAKAKPPKPLSLCGVRENVRLKRCQSVRVSDHLSLLLIFSESSPPSTVLRQRERKKKIKVKNSEPVQAGTRYAQLTDTRVSGTHQSPERVGDRRGWIPRALSECFVRQLVEA